MVYSRNICRIRFQEYFREIKTQDSRFMKQRDSNRFIFLQTMSSGVYFSFMSYDDSPIERLIQEQIQRTAFICFFFFHVSFVLE